MIAELLPCAHCGYAAVREFEPERISRFRVGCVACGISTPWCYTEAMADDRWNRRTPPCTPHEVSDAEVEAARTAVVAAGERVEFYLEGSCGVEVGNGVTPEDAIVCRNIMVNEVLRTAISAALAIRGK